MSKSRTPRITAAYSREKCWALSFEFNRHLINGWLPPINQNSIRFYQFLINLVQQTTGELQESIRRDNSIAHKVLELDSWSKEVLDFLNSSAVSSFFNNQTPELWSFTYCFEYKSPERFYAFVVERVLYPVMWDPEHRYSGRQMKTKDLVTCSGGMKCLHA